MQSLTDQELPLSPCERLDMPLLRRLGLNVLIKRDDLLRSELSGNKFRKLILQIPELQKAGAGATFGGVHSTHLFSFAKAGKAFNFATTGFVRSDEASDTAVISLLRSLNMKLIFLDRARYRDRNDQSFKDELQRKYGPFLLVNEGGTNSLAIDGVAALISEIPGRFDVICCAAGTGGTAVGLMKGIQERRSNARVLAFSSIHPKGKLRAQIDDMRHHHRLNKVRYDVIEEFDFGGFAKSTPDLMWFIDSFARRTGIVLDPVYNAKMFFGFFTLATRGAFKPDETIVLYESGGLPDFSLFE